MRKASMLLAIICLTGCASMDITRPDKEFHDAAKFVKEGKYHEAIKLYKRIERASPSSPLAADSQYELAIIRAFHDNPERDYVQAIHGLEEFIKQHPDHNRTPEAHNWISILRQVLDLKRDIEQLKKVDIRHEERRKLAK